MATSGPGNAGSSDNYLPYAAGPGGDFETESCVDVSSDDVAIVIDTASYEPATLTTTLAFNSGQLAVKTTWRGEVMPHPVPRASADRPSTSALGFSA